MNWWLATTDSLIEDSILYSIVSMGEWPIKCIFNYYKKNFLHGVVLMMALLTLSSIEYTTLITLNRGQTSMCYANFCAQHFKYWIIYYTLHNLIYYLYSLWLLSFVVCTISQTKNIQNLKLKYNKNRQQLKEEAEEEEEEE